MEQIYLGKEAWPAERR